MTPQKKATRLQGPTQKCACSSAAGFKKHQAELIVSALVTLTTANMDIVYKDMVTKAHQVEDFNTGGGWGL